MTNEIDDAQALMVKALDHMNSMYEARFNQLEKMVQTQEQQLAMLVQAYVEVAAMMESVTSLIFNRSEEDKKEFFEALAISRKNMIETMQHGITLAEQNADRFTAHAAAPTRKSEGAEADDNG